MPRPCFRLLVRVVCALSVLLAGGGDLLAQAGGGLDCEYAACALRVKSGFGGRSLVRGTEAEKVSGLGYWVGDLDEVFAGSPLAQDLAASYRHRHNVGSVFRLTGLAAVAVGVIWSISNPDDPYLSAPYSTVVLGGVLTWFTGVLIRQSRSDRLHEAVWEYNRRLNYRVYAQRRGEGGVG